MRFSASFAVIVAGLATTSIAGTSTYAPISQIFDGQIQAPTGPEVPPPAPTTWYHNTTKPSGPAGTSPPPPYPTSKTHSKPSNGTVTVATSKQNTITSSVAATAPPSSARPPPAVQSTGAGSSLVLNGGTGMSFAALIAYILA